MATFLVLSKMGPNRQSTIEYLHINLVKIGPVDLEFSLLKSLFSKEEINASRTYSFSLRGMHKRGLNKIWT